MWLIGISGHGADSLFSQWGQHYKFAMSVHCHKSEPILIWPQMLLGRKTTTNKQGNRPIPRAQFPMLRTTRTMLHTFAVFRDAMPAVQNQVRHPAVVRGDRLEPAHCLVLQGLLPEDLLARVHPGLTARVSHSPHVVISGCRGRGEVVKQLKGIPFLS